MSRINPLCRIALFAAGLLALAPLAAMHSAPPSSEPETPAFARRIAGSWFLTFTSSPNARLRALVTLNADGTLTGCDTSDFGVGGRSLESAIHGVWRQTGPREAAATFLGFAYDNVTGEHTATLRARGTIIFDAGFQQWSVEPTTIDVFEPHQDPTDPSAMPFLTVVEPLVFVSRLNVMN